MTACSTNKRTPGELRFLIESSPNNLDLRQGTDAQSERVGALIYEPLVHRDAQFHLQPWLAQSWERQDANTWVFHLRPNVHFHDGHIMTSSDVAWTLRSMSNGALVSAKASAYAKIASIETPDRLTMIVHTSAPDASLLFNLSDGLFGVVRDGAGRDEGLHPVGTGPFRFASQTQDKDVVLERHDAYWGEGASIPRLRFDVVPDAITMALEMKRGSADVEANAITLDEVAALEKTPSIEASSTPSTTVIYAQFNVADPALSDVRVRQAIAYALDKPAIISTLWHGKAIEADSLLPPGHWARASDRDLQQYPHSLKHAMELLDQAGLKPDKDGVRLRFTLKTSTDEMTRVLAQAVQQQLRRAGIAMAIRPAEFGTFYADITHGAFQMYILRWTGASNLDPDIFRYAYSSASFPPKGGNRGHYRNDRVDALLKQAAAATDESQRRALYVEVQKILAVDLPSIPLWYPSNVVLHSQRVVDVQPDASGSFSFLRSAKLRQQK